MEKYQNSFWFIVNNKVFKIFQIYNFSKFFKYKTRFDDKIKKTLIW